MQTSQMGFILSVALSVTRVLLTAAGSKLTRTVGERSVQMAQM